MRRLAVLLAAVAVAIPRATHAAPPLPLKLLVLPSPRTPELFQGDGRSHIAYELLLANFSPETIRIDSLRLSGPVEPSPGMQLLTAVARYEDLDAKALKSMFSLIGANTQKPQEAVLKSCFGTTGSSRNGPTCSRWRRLESRRRGKRFRWT